MTCAYCNDPATGLDTGSLSRDMEGYLDCPYCNTAAERVALESWALASRVDCRSASALWLIHQHGVAAAAHNNARSA